MANLIFLSIAIICQGASLAQVSTSYDFIAAFLKRLLASDHCANKLKKKNNKWQIDTKGKNLSHKSILN